MVKPKDGGSPVTVITDEEAHRALMWVATVFIPIACLLAYGVYDLFKIFK